MYLYRPGGGMFANKTFANDEGLIGEIPEPLPTDRLLKLST